MGAADVIDRAIDAVEGTPMKWGRDDCAMWIAGILRELYGVDLGKGWRCKYRSEKGAARLLGAKGKGLTSAVARTARKHGWKRVDATEAEPGDLGVFLTREHGPACAVCLQRGAWVGRVDYGVALVKNTPRYVWRAPCPR